VRIGPRHCAPMLSERHEDFFLAGFLSGRWVVVQIRRGPGHNILAGEPTAEIDLGAAQAAEWAVCEDGRAVADRAARGGTGDRTGRQCDDSLSGCCVTTMNIVVEKAARATIRAATVEFLPNPVQPRLQGGAAAGGRGRPESVGVELPRPTVYALHCPPDSRIDSGARAAFPRDRASHDAS